MWIRIRWLLYISIQKEVSSTFLDRVTAPTELLMNHLVWVAELIFRQVRLAAPAVFDSIWSMPRSVSIDAGEKIANCPIRRIGSHFSKSRLVDSRGKLGWTAYRWTSHSPIHDSRSNPWINPKLKRMTRHIDSHVTLVIACTAQHNPKSTSNTHHRNDRMRMCRNHHSTDTASIVISTITRNRARDMCSLCLIRVGHRNMRFSPSRIFSCILTAISGRISGTLKKIQLYVLDESRGEGT